MSLCVVGGGATQCILPRGTGRVRAIGRTGLPIRAQLQSDPTDPSRPRQSRQRAFPALAQVENSGGNRAKLWLGNVRAVPEAPAGKGRLTACSCTDANRLRICLGQPGLNRNSPVRHLSRGCQGCRTES
jgi:hypothetical protein